MLITAQEKNNRKSETDSIQTTLAEDGIIIKDSILTKEKYINPLAPSKAAFYSAVLPGLGQAYNKKYWKVPIVWGAIGTGIGFYTFFDNEYNELRDAFRRKRVGLLINNPRIPEDTSDDVLERLQNSTQSDRDLTLLVTILLYALNIVDANVDAHLKQFNISDDLSWDMNLQPYLETNPINTNPNFGMALTITF